MSAYKAPKAVRPKKDKLWTKDDWEHIADKHKMLVALEKAMRDISDGASALGRLEILHGQLCEIAGFGREPGGEKARGA